MRVAYLSPTAALGGAERSLLDLIASLPAALPGFAPALVCGEPGPLCEAAAALGAEVEVVPLPPALGGLGDAALRGGGLGAALGFLGRAPRAGLEALGFGRALRATLQGLRPDWIHSNALKTHALTPSYQDLAPVAWHLRDALGQRRVAAPLLRWASRGATVGLGISRYVVRDAREILPRLPLLAIENAIELPRFAPTGPTVDLDALSGLAPAPPGTLRLGLLATYGRWKGQDAFLAALGRLPRELPWRAYLIGGPIYRTQGSQWTPAELRQLASQAGLLAATPRLGFLPFQDDPAPALRALDVVVHASTAPEPFGRTIAEAMACERALVVSAAGGAAELFTPEREALGAPPGDVPALARALERLLRDPDLRARLGRAAGELARSRFDRARLGREVAAVYRGYAGVRG